MKQQRCPKTQKMIRNIGGGSSSLSEISTPFLSWCASLPCLTKQFFCPLSHLLCYVSKNKLRTFIYNFCLLEKCIFYQGPIYTYWAAWTWEGHKTQCQLWTVALLSNLKPEPCRWRECMLPSVQFSSVTQSCPTLWDPMNCSLPGLPVHHQLPEFTQNHVHWVSDAIQPSHPLSSPSPSAPTPPSITVFSNESTLCMRWPKYWSFSFSIIPSKEHLRLISFRMDWLDLLAVQGTLKSSPTPQFKNINSSALSFLHSPTFTSIHTTGKTIALTRWTFFDKVMSLLFNMLSRLVITFMSWGKSSVVHALQALPTHASHICLLCSSLPTTQLNKWT